VQSPLVRHTEFARALRAIADADILISTGGTYLVDNYDFSNRALELQYAHRLGKRIVLWTQSLGPFASSQTRARIKPIVECNPRAYLRDDESLRSWVRAGGDSLHASVAPDAVFGLAPQGANDAVKDRMLISVREWKWAGPTGRLLDEGQYARSMRTAASIGADQGLKVIAISTCQGVANYVDDSRYARRVFADSEADVDSNFHTPTQLLAEISSARVVVTTRMHLAILALISGVPTIAIAYEFKTRALFEALGLGRYAVAIEEVDEGWMRAALRSISEEPERAVLSIDKRKQLREDAFKPAFESVTMRDVS
jgi:colanic acid/amylovoran biosynthesis protein